MRTLYLLRHAKAEASGPQFADADRPLSARGREACQQMGQHMKQKGYLPALTLSSPSARTRETVELVGRALGADLPCRYEPGLYLATPGEMLDFIAQVGAEVPSLMLVGHNPGMHHLAMTLAGDGESELHDELALKYPTGALAVISWPAAADWQGVSAQAGELRDFIAPDDLA